MILLHLFFPDWQGFVKLPHSLDVCNVNLELPYFLIYFPRNYSFLDLEIVANSNSCRNISISYVVNWIFAAETIQGRKIFKGGIYSRQEIIQGRKLYEEMQYLVLFHKLATLCQAKCENCVLRKANRFTYQ